MRGMWLRYGKDAQAFVEDAVVELNNDRPLTAAVLALLAIEKRLAQNALSSYDNANR